MQNISNINRLINGFKKQNKRTVWNYLAKLAKDPSIYSERLSAVGPHFTDRELYLYIDHYNLVLVCLDNCAYADELADEEMFNDELPLYFTECSHRTSPVWLLTETLKLIRKKLEENNLIFRLRGVLLSESHFLNADDMRPLWEEKDITVIDSLKNMSDQIIPVSPNENLMHGALAMKALRDLVKQQGQTSEEADAEFQRMLNEFLSDMSGKEKADTGKEEKPEEEEDEEVLSDEEDTSVDDDELLIDLPSGVIEQNASISVKVQILPPLANPRAELDRLVGCTDIKSRLDELLSLTRYNKRLREAFPQAKQHEVSLHSIFFGRPGTGKTTVCKIFGSLLHEAGALSKGHVVVANRGTFIGTLWGDEERSVRQVLEIARGGVLMIDEAYLLNGKHEHDPGKLVVQLLMEVLADEAQRDLAVVLCGYKEPMLQLLDSNPGLPSRFPNRFEFKDFSVDDLLEISRRRVDEYQYHFTPQAWQKYRDVLTQAYQVRDPQSWGNARFVANQLERIYIRHAQRCTNGKPVTDKQLLTLTPADIVSAEMPRPKPHIGF